MRSLVAPTLLLLLALASRSHGATIRTAAKDDLEAEEKAGGTNTANQRAETLKAKAQEHVKKLGLQDKIKHIIVLMEENRSYDHLMGFYGKGDGLTGQEFNLQNPNDGNSYRVYVSNGTTYINPGDPDHSVPGTTMKLFGPNGIQADKPPTMDGFVWEEKERLGAYYPYGGVMQMFSTRKQLPVLTALADNFVSCDRFFAGVPGPTWPNRQFFLSATSNGLTETFFFYNRTPGLLYPQKTIFDQVDEVGASWKVYYEDTPWELFMETLAHSPENLHSMDQFFEDCTTGDLPHFAYLNPRSGINITTGVGSNDEHPDHDVALAEAHYKRVYEAIRASPVWNETLFIITYDEHGGFYDHVPPPMDVPPPRPHMNLTSYPDSFNFDRLGVRMPTLLISPWLEKGAILSGPPAAQKPFPNSEYDTTSIMATIRKIIPGMSTLPPLTGRDAWVATWEHIFDDNITTPRTDCPVTLPEAPAPTLSSKDEADKVLNHLQKEILSFHAALHGKNESIYSHITKQGHVSQWLLDSYLEHHDRTLKWKASKKRKPVGPQSQKKEEAEETTSSSSGPVPAPSYIELGLQNLKQFAPPINGQEWLLGRMPGMTGTGKMTISALYTNFSTKVDTLFCLDGAGMKEGSVLTVSNCYPTAAPEKNRDTDQQWTLHKDATLRPFSDDSLCVTNRFYASNQTDDSLFLKPCDQGDVTQHYAYHGHDGNGFPGQIVFGDGANFITIYTGPGGGGPT